MHVVNIITRCLPKRGPRKAQMSNGPEDLNGGGLDDIDNLSFASI